MEVYRTWMLLVPRGASIVFSGIVFSGIVFSGIVGGWARARGEERSDSAPVAPQSVRLMVLQQPGEREDNQSDDELAPLERQPGLSDRFDDRRRDPFADRSGSGRGYRSRPSTRLASVPNMFGDFFGTGGDVLLQPPSDIIQQVWTDRSPVPFRVFNQEGGLGASLDPTVPIIARTASGQIVTMSIGVGEDNSNDEFPDTYPIAEPAGSRPMLAGTVVYLGGKAVYFGGGEQRSPNFQDPDAPQDPDNPQQPADGTSDQNWALLFEHRVDPDPVQIALAGGGGAAVRRVRLSENNSPEPRDRFVFNYSFFSDVVGNLGDVNRYIFGVEKTFFDSTASLEFRFPFASTVASDQVFGASMLSDTEWGNLSLIYKQLLWQTETGLISGGVGLALPTADDARILLPDGRPILVMENESVHLLPFVAHIYRSGNLFLQSFVQLDVDANGNRVTADFTGANLESIGTLQDATLLFLDLGAGYTTFANPGARGITRITPMAEVHYVTPLQDADIASDGTFTITNFQNRFDMVNATFGVDFQCRDHLHIRPGMTVPLRGNDREFDYEVQLQVNAFY